MPTLNRTDDAHCLGSTGIAMATFLDDSQRGVEAISEPTSFLRKAFIGGDNRQMLQLLLCEVTRLKNLCSQFVNRDIEEALNLACMHIHRKHTMGTGNRDAIRNQTGSDGNAWLVLLIGTAIGVVGNNGGDASSGGTF